MVIANWITGNYIELFGAVAGIIYVFLEIRQNLWLWPVGIITSAVYIWVFFTGKLYADAGLQGYYLIISVLGWYWWVNGAGLRAQGAGQDSGGGEQEKGRGGEEERGREGEKDAGLRAKGAGLQRVDSPFEGGKGDVLIKGKELRVTHIRSEKALILLLVFAFLFALMWIVLDNLTDSPVPGWDSFITALSIIATWMLARKIFEHWYLWMVVNAVAAVLFLSRGLYPTVVLYGVYFAMSFIGLKEWRKTMPPPPTTSPGGEWD